MTIYHRPADRSRGILEDWGHIFLYVRNDETGESAYFDYYPEDGYSVLGAVDEARIAPHASLTIETTARQEQAMLEAIKARQQSLPEWRLRVVVVLLGGGSTCVTQSLEILSAGGIRLKGRDPGGVWRSAYRSYSDEYLRWKQNQSRKGWPGRFFAVFHPGPGYESPQAGVEYGRDPHGQARRADPQALNNQTMYFRKGKRVK
ncbi:MAG TPA: hypothetical protein VFD58_16735 [Blastocatellia bacterium]|nr:hypothetical protein [Blastocatellia bacterium]